MVWNGELDCQRKVTSQPLLTPKACGQVGASREIWEVRHLHLPEWNPRREADGGV